MNKNIILCSHAGENDYEAVAEDINDIIENGDDKIKNVFYNTRYNRAVASSYSLVIILEGEVIGFIRTVHESFICNNFEFIDLAIKKEYRGNGYGLEALRKLKESIKNNNPRKIHYIIETKENNIGAKKCAEKVGSLPLVLKANDLVYYLLDENPKMTKEDFIRFNAYLESKIRGPEAAIQYCIEKEKVKMLNI